MSALKSACGQKNWHKTQLKLSFLAIVGGKKIKNEKKMTNVKNLEKVILAIAICIKVK